MSSRCRHTPVKRESDFFQGEKYVKINYCSRCGTKKSGYMRKSKAYNPADSWVVFNPFNGEKIGKRPKCLKGMDFNKSNLSYESNYTDEQKMTLDELADHYLVSDLDAEMSTFEWLYYKFKILYGTT